jgi:phosphate transport system protein
MNNNKQEKKKHFEEELNLLNNKLLEMVEMVKTMIKEAINALKELDSTKAKQIIELDDKVDLLELEIDELCLSLLALRQPMAIDLRFITTAMKINVDLERMADCAVNIAERVIDLAGKPLIKPLIDIPRMAEMVLEMLTNGINAHIKKDTNLAKKVCLSDKQIDQLNEQIFRELLTFMMSDPLCIPRALPLIMISRYIERIGDHATNIAEDVIFMIDAKMVKHRYKELV